MSEVVMTLLEILKYILPAIIVLIATSMIVNKFLVSETEKKHLALYGQKVEETFKLRMQAYERLTHYVERIHPNALIGRHYMKGATAQEIQLSMVKNIREEYEHNLSQQLYVSNEVWQTVKSAKEQEITMINNIGSQMAQGASASEFVQRITQFALDKDTEVPTDIALFILNKEAKQIMLANE
jgi:hypothetical protein